MTGYLLGLISSMENDSLLGSLSLLMRALKGLDEKKIESHCYCFMDSEINRLCV